MTLTEEQKKHLLSIGRGDLVEIGEINASGYAGILGTGQIVDRREYPNAIPIQENPMFGIPKPKPLPDDTSTKG